MRLQFAVQHVRLDRKLLKPQVEKRRRERINRCLQTLTKMLLQDRAHQKRTEKAEILEHTVAFLRSNSHHDNNNFHNGFSSCLQRASEFLQQRDIASNQKLTLSSRLDMVAVRHHHHHHHLKADVQDPLSPTSVAKPPSPKAGLWNPRSPGGHFTCQVPSERADLCSPLRSDAQASVSIGNNALVPPPSSISTLPPPTGVSPPQTRMARAAVPANCCHLPSPCGDRGLELSIIPVAWQPFFSSCWTDAWRRWSLMGDRDLLLPFQSSSAHLAAPSLDYRYVCK